MKKCLSKLGTRKCRVKKRFLLNLKRCLKFWQELLRIFFKMPLVVECQNQYWKAPVIVLLENSSTKLQIKAQ